MTPQPTLTMYRGWPDPNLYVWSPFVTKLEARLRFSGLPYKCASGSLKSAPRGKIPYLDLTPADNAGPVEQLSDSTLIVKDLTARGMLNALNDGLSKTEKATDLALRALLEDKLGFYHSWERWTQNYNTMRDHVMSSIPYFIRIFIGQLAYRNTVATLHGQGTGRFSAEEIGEFRNEIWSSFNDLLLESKVKNGTKGKGDDEPFWVLGGDEPTEVDATLFGFIVSALLCTAGPGSKADVKSFPVLGEYAKRIHGRYFPEYDNFPM
ncbi:hypothetical protein GGR57DRAFT_470119 [Xylariaceae sp. FL1272]|nr:hypothetical protein GGR57DRAFT_470119 [Xylariaceae sp. FL1272]